MYIAVIKGFERCRLRHLGENIRSAEFSFDTIVLKKSKFIYGYLPPNVMKHQTVELLNIIQLLLRL